MENFEQTSIDFATIKADNEIHNLNPETYYPLALRWTASEIRRNYQYGPIIRTKQLLEVALILGDY